jgi:periplasmic copper chaperone A
MRLTFTATIVGLALLAGCGAKEEYPTASKEAASSDASAAVATVAAGPFQVSGATIRPPAGGRDVTAGYVTLANPGAPDRLIGASSPATTSIELHTHSMTDGMMQMRKVDGFDLPTGGSLTLASGGDHLMLFGVKPDVLSEGTVPVTLTFEKAGPVEVSFTVGEPAAGDAGHGGDHGGGHKDGK